MLSRSPAVKWAFRPLKSNARSGQAFGEHIIGESDNLRAARVDIPMHVANQMTDAGGLSQITWVHNEDLFIRRAYHVCGFSVVMQQLAGMKNRAGWQFKREGHAVRRLEQPADTTAIDGAHGQFDNRQSRRRLGVRVENSNGNRCRRGRGHSDRP